jgi:hypothetical protein
VGRAVVELDALSGAGCVDGGDGKDAGTVPRLESLGVMGCEDGVATADTGGLASLGAGWAEAASAFACGTATGVAAVEATAGVGATVAEAVSEAPDLGGALAPFG